MGFIDTKTKFLFLDVDGVLNCRRTPHMQTEIYPLDPFMVLLVHRIIEATNCRIVLSSSWRNHPQGINVVGKSIPLIGITPSFSNNRGKEIQKWLNDQTWALNQGQIKYAILDDDSDMLPEQMPNFFKTTFEFGLTEEIANKVIKHLNS
jgi:hypothetical protein